MCNRYTLLLHGIEFNTTQHLRCKFLMVTHGILAQQYTLQERGLQPPPSFKGVISYAGTCRLYKAQKFLHMLTALLGIMAISTFVAGASAPMMYYHRREDGWH